MARTKKEKKEFTTKGWFKCESVPNFTIKENEFMVAFNCNPIIGSYCAFTEINVESRLLIVHLRDALDRILNDYDNIVKQCNID